MNVKVLGGSSVHGYLGESPDWTTIEADTGRTLFSFENGAFTVWKVDDTMEQGGQLLASGNYVNPAIIATDSLSLGGKSAAAWQAEIDEIEALALAGL